MPTSTQDLAALAAATDAQGRVDLTRFEAQRRVLAHQTLDGLDAEGLVRELIASPEYRDEKGRAQVGTLIEAIGSGLSDSEGKRFAEALDRHDVGEGLLERGTEWIGDQGAAAWSWTRGRGTEADQFISDSLSGARQWAEGTVEDRGNSFLERAAARMAHEGFGQAQDTYGAMKGASQATLGIIGDTVDLTKFAAKFSTDADFRGLIVSAAALYIDEARRDPSKPYNDAKNAAVGAWNEWAQGLKEAQAQGKEREYLGEAKGAIGLEALAAAVPVGAALKLGKLGRVAGKIDVPDGPDVDTPNARRNRGDADQGVLDELTELALRAQREGGPDVEMDERFFQSLAGVRRSQGDLRGLVDDMRAQGRLDGLLESGALSPKQLGYLARQDISAFDGNVSFERALGRWVADKDLTQRAHVNTGDIGEALVANKLAREGYRDLVAIQNNSGHGNDLVGLHPTTGQWEVFEVKASLHGKAIAQTGDPQPTILGRLQLADAGLGKWRPETQWEERAQNVARRVIEDATDPMTGKFNVQARWARVNIVHDPTTGDISADLPKEFEKWVPPSERRTPAPAPVAPEATPRKGAMIEGNMSQPDHPGYRSYQQSYAEVRRMDSGAGIAEGTNTGLLAAAVASTVEREKLQLQRVELGEGGRVYAVERGPYPEFKERRVGIDTTQALSGSIDEASKDWLAARSPRYADGATLERSPDFATSLARMPPGDRALYDALRAQVPGGVSDEHVALAAMQASNNGITDPGKLAGATMRDDTLWVVGNTPGFRTSVDVSGQTPNMQQVADHAQSNEQQRQMALAAEREMTERTLSAAQVRAV